jgi:hypothetical protein
VSIGHRGLSRSQPASEKIAQHPRVKRPRVRGLEQRFESRLLPLFVRRTEAVSELLPQLYLHGLAQGDFELALRGLLGDGAPLWASSIERLRAKWQLEFEAWRSRRLDNSRSSVRLGRRSLCESGS